MITALKFDLDHTEYSKYDDSVAVVNAAVTATGGTVGDALTWSISRLDGFGIVQQGITPLTSPTATISIDLRTIADEDNINWANAGKYQFQVMDTVSGLTTTQIFYVSIITVEEMKRKWIYGVPLISSDLVAPVLPPQTPGITFLTFSRDHKIGPRDLVITAGPPRMISWGDGPAVPVPTVRSQIALTTDCKEYIIVQIDPALLPTTSTVEQIIIDREKMKDEDIRGFINQAVGWVEGFTHVSAEPRLAMTTDLWAEKGKPYTDEFVQPQSWYRPGNTMEWLNFKVPVRRLLKVYDVEGYFQTVRSTVVPLGQWLVHDEYDGLLIFIPRSGAIINWETIQSTFMNFLFGRDFVPDFWHYRIAHGLRSLDIESNITYREAIAKKAAIEILLQAGSAQKAGIASESVSRDGVSQSTSYTQSAMYGIYSHITIPYGDWLKDNMPLIKRRIGGMEFVTL